MIISERAGLANDAVTRDDEGNRICADRAPDRASSLRLANCLRQKPPIGRERAEWDVQQRPPNSQLERRAPDKCAQTRTRFILRPPNENLVRQLRGARIASI